MRHHSASITAAASSSNAIRAAATAHGGGGSGDGDGGDGDLGTGGKIFFSSLCLLTFGLGVWQTQRYFEKVDMVHKRQEDLTLDPIPNYYDWVDATKKKTDDDSDSNTAPSTTNNNHGSSSKSYRRVNLRGTFQHEHEIFIGPRGPPPGALAETGPNSGRGGGGGGMSSSTQGYLVVTPFVIAREDEKDDDDATNISADKDVVWINRGWIPRHFLHHPNSHIHRHRQHHQPHSNDYLEIITSYSQPSGIIELLTMESNTDTPGKLSFAPPSRVEPSSHRSESNVHTVIENDASTTPAGSTTTQEQSPPQPSTTTTSSHEKLLWMDRPAMEELTSSPSNYHPPLFVEINTTDDGTTTDAAGDKTLQYPVKSTQEYVGEFKVTPEIHAAYAVTWFGLSGAGVLMTRKLLSRGRL